MEIKFPRRTGSAAALLAVAALALGACGDSDDGGGSDSGSGSGSGGTDLAQFEAASKKAQEPTTWPGPDSSPPAAKDKKINVIVCASVAEGCVRIGEGVKEAAEALGWQVTVQDGQGKPDTARSLMLQGISQKVDGIILAAISSKTVGDAMVAARRAGVPVVSVVGGNTSGDGRTDVFAEPDAQPEMAGEQLANWLVADSGGKAKIAMFHAPEFTDSRKRYDGSKKVFDSCGDCEIVVDEDYAAASAAQQIPLRIKSTLLANPDIDYVWIDIGGYGALAVQAIREQSNSDVKLVSFDCNLEDLKNIREGSAQPACEGLGLEAGGWGGVDELNRAFNDEPPAKDYIPIRVITKDNLPPAGEAWKGDYDYQAEYEKIWGVQ